MDCILLGSGKIFPCSKICPRLGSLAWKNLQFNAFKVNPESVTRCTAELEQYYLCVLKSFPFDIELPKYQATITQPQKASQVPSDNSVTDVFITAEDENNPTEATVAENRTVMGNQQLIQKDWYELDTIEAFYQIAPDQGNCDYSYTNYRAAVYCLRGGNVLSLMFNYNAILDFCC